MKRIDLKIDFRRDVNDSKYFGGLIFHVFLFLTYVLHIVLNFDPLIGPIVLKVSPMETFTSYFTQVDVVHQSVRIDMWLIIHSSLI